LNPNVRSITSVNPDSELIPVARSAGVLTALSVPEGGIISGQSAVLRLDGWTPEEMIVLSPAAMHLRWPNLKIDRRPRARKSVKEMQLKFVLVDGDDAWRIAPQLKESDVPVILGPATSLPPRRDDDYDSAWSSAAKLQADGVRFCIASNGRGAETNERNIGYE